MNAREQGFLLLTSQLGEPNRRPLTVSQFRTLAQRAQQLQPPQQPRELELSDLIAMGYDFLAGEHILSLLAQEDLLARYLEQGALSDCFPITRISPSYPLLLRQRLGLDSPGSLWAKGPIELLDTPLIALVGSRDLEAPNHAFAAEVGKQAATTVSRWFPEMPGARILPRRKAALPTEVGSLALLQINSPNIR